MLQIRLVSFLLLLVTWSSVHGQNDHSLAPEEMMKLIPDKFKDFHQLEVPKARKIKLGNINYSLCEKKFSKRKNVLKILLFDYKEAPIMYRQAMKDWGGRPIIQTDSLISRSFSLPNCSGWESYNQHNKQSQIFIGICDRFYMMMTGENIELEILKAALAEIRVQDFPK